MATEYGEVHMAHTSPITTLDSSEKFGLVVSGGYDGRIICWQRDGRALWDYSAADLVNQVVFDPSGSRVAAAAADAFVYGFDAATGSIAFELGPHRDDVNSVAWHPGADVIVTVADAKDGRVHVWSTRDHCHLGLLEGHETGVFSVAFDPAGRRLATSGADRSVRIWDFDSRKEILRLDHPTDCEVVVWAPDGRSVVTGCDDGSIMVWDSETGALLRKAGIATSTARFIRFSPDGHRMLLGAYDGVLRIVDACSLETVSTLARDFQWERSAAFLGDDVIVGTFGAEPIWYRNGREAGSGTKRTYGINSIAVSTVSQPRIFVGRDDGSVIDVAGDVLVHVHDTIVNAVAPSPIAPVLASGDYRGLLRLHDLDTGSSRECRQTGGPINAMTWSPDGRVVVTGGYDGCLRWWTDELSLLAEETAHESPVKSLAWSAVADMLLTGSSDDSVSGWRGGKRLFRSRAPGVELINCVAASPSQPVFATASRDCRIRLWDAHTGEVLETLPAVHSKSIKSIAFSPDGRRLVSGSYDGTGILWSRAGDGRWVWRRLRLHGKPGVPAVAFDGSAALTAGWDGTVGRWSPEGRLICQYRLDLLG